MMNEVPDRIAASRRESRTWILGSLCDAFFIANCCWPLLLMLTFTSGFEGQSGIQFWQLYFVTTPHRWITLFVVLLDRERFQERYRTFILVAVVICGICLGVRLTTGTLTCLLAVDYIWNAWHFAAQHHGIYRIYCRLGTDSSSSSGSSEKWLFRGFLLYVIFRTASSASDLAESTEWLRVTDWISLVIPGWLVFREIWSPGGENDEQKSGSLLNGRRLYLFSLLSLYVSLLFAVHARRPQIVLSLATASAWFHACEYLAIVGWHIQRRAAESGSRLSFLQWIAPRWGITLLLYVTVLGSGSLFLDHDAPEIWLLINVIVAFLHYSYDGMIWKNRRAGPRGAVLPQSI